MTLIATEKNAAIPLNYQYPLSAAIYRILSRGDDEYARFLHETGYGKGYKFFTFSDLHLQYRRADDRLILTRPDVNLTVCFHLPEASQTFVQGLFRSEKIVIADKKSKAVLNIQSVLALDNPLKELPENQIVKIAVRPISALVAGSKNDENNYAFYAPDHPDFLESLLLNWRNKITACWGEETALDSLLAIEVEFYEKPFRSRLITIKDNSPAERTQIRGFLNFKLWLMAERRFLDLVLNAGLGLYSAQGMGCLEAESVRG